MKDYVLTAAIFFSLIASTSAFACSFDAECGVGAKCVKQKNYDAYGVCVGGYDRGAPRDSGGKPYGDKAGNSCSYDTECGVGARCVKADKYSLNGTCSG